MKTTKLLFGCGSGCALTKEVWADMWEHLDKEMKNKIIQKVQINIEATKRPNIKMEYVPLRD